jgi:hypothetical protein
VVRGGSFFVYVSLTVLPDLEYAVPIRVTSLVARAGPDMLHPIEAIAAPSQKRQGEQHS